MKIDLLQRAAECAVKHRRKKRWQKTVMVMASVVVFCTTYALILPAITMEKATTCGVPEHQHAEVCYQKVEKNELDCSLARHQHSGACHAGDGTRICGYSDSVIHCHDDTCYDSAGNMVCQLPEISSHAHTGECYRIAETVAEAQSQPDVQVAHTHSDTCYQQVKGALTCQVIPSQGHAHGTEDGCYDEAGELICTTEASEAVIHEHTEECYAWEKALICELPEVAEIAEPIQPVETGEKPVEKILVCERQECVPHQHALDCYGSGGELVCGKPEILKHNHTQDCFRQVVEKPLVCTLEESQEHQHNEACYAELPLVCGLEEHTHDLNCYTDTTADVERAADWEATVPQELSGNWSEDLIAVAESQLGYKESTRNYIVLNDGITTRGYTRYGAWYGDHYGDWCAMFVSFCLNYANISEQYVPYEASCPRWMEKLREKDLFRDMSEYTPVRGDIVFFDNNGNARPDHVGIVETVDADTGVITTIEGNNGLRVARHEYKQSELKVLGYGILPENPSETNHGLSERVVTAVIYKDENALEVADDGTQITVSGLLPEGAVARAYPVSLDQKLINGEAVLLAYDIAIFDAAGQPVEQGGMDAPFVVSIQPGDWAGRSSENENYTVYYIPDEGEPEPMDTVEHEVAVTFTTEHFSVYALTATGSLDSVYLNGTSGSDGNAGTQRAPVATLDKALSLVKQGGTIYISGTMTVSNAQDWDLESSGVTIQRLSSFTGPLIIVADGASLNLANITINGGSEVPSDSKIATNNTYASGSAKAPLIVVNSGGSLVINDGALLTNNSNKPDTNSSGYFKENSYVGQGGAIYCNGTLTMNGGTIRYCEAESGGGIYVENGVFHLLGGLIDSNYARDIVTYSSRKDNYHKNAGGGVYVGDNSTMNMSGGTISNNQTSREGGGVSLGWLNRTKGAAISEFITTFNMTGGTFTGNTATSTGGGLNITAGRQAFISAGTFTKNTANGQEYQPDSGYSAPSNVYSGGAIYLDAKQKDSYGNYAGKPGYAVVDRVLITKNSAGYYGGGIACCATSNASFNASVDLNGSAIYNNTAPYGNEMHVSGSVKVVGDTVLGGGDYGWEKSGSAYDNSLTDDSPAIIAAKKMATVIITDNYGLDGGGIGCNGTIEIGGENGTTSISISKCWEMTDGLDLPEYIVVQVLQNGQPYGDPIKIYSVTDSQGNTVWPTYYLDGLPEGYTYTIEEIQVPGFSSTITNDGNAFTITNTAEGFRVIKKWAEDAETDRPDSIQVQLYQDGTPFGKPVELTAENHWSHIWISLPEGHTYTAKEIYIPDGYYSTNDGALNADGEWEITNTKIPTTSISAEKQWADGTTGADSVTLQLMANGKPYGDPVALSAANNWFCKWEELPECDTAGNAIVYDVNELAVNGYEASVKKTEWTEGGNTVYQWKQVSELEENKTYLFVSSQGALAGSGFTGLKWLNVDGNLTAGTMPDNAAIWTYSGGKLKNGEAKYLNYSYGNFRSGQSGVSINLAEGKLYYYNQNTNYYFSGISSAYGSSYGTASSNSSTATQFTVYERTSSTTAEVTNTHFIVTNTKKPDSVIVNFAKYSTGKDENGNVTLIKGAELALYRQGDSEVVIPGTDVTGVLLGEWTSENALGESGGIHTLELSSGRYYLIETKAPYGHVGLTAPIIFEVSAESGQIHLIQYPQYDEFLLDDPDGGVQTDGNSVAFPIYNAVAYTLPETGGPGTALYFLGGLLLMIAAGLPLLYNHKKRGKEESISS